MDKKIRQTRLARQNRVRRRLTSRSSRPRLVVNRSLRHISTQVIDSNGHVLASATSNKKDFQSKGTKTEQAQLVGQQLADKIKKAKIDQLVFDRGYYRYHGRVKALVETLRQSGIKI